MKYRIKKYSKGWIVEYREKKLFKTRWHHVTHYAGLPSRPFHYGNARGALRGALDHIEKEIIYSFHIR